MASWPVVACGKTRCPGIDKAPGSGLSFGWVAATFHLSHPRFSGAFKQDTSFRWQPRTSAEHFLLLGACPHLRTAVIDLYQSRWVIAAVVLINRCVSDRTGDHPMDHEGLPMLVGSLQDLAIPCIRPVNHSPLVPLRGTESRDRHGDKKWSLLH